MTHTIIEVATLEDAAARTLTDYAATTTRPEFLEFLVAPQAYGRLATAAGLEQAIRSLYAERVASMEQKGYGTKPPGILALWCELVWPDVAKGTRIIVRM